MHISPIARKLNDKIAKGFNTWDVQSVTSHVYLPYNIRFNVSFFNTCNQLYSSSHLWDSVERFGEHSLDGSYTDVYIRFENSKYRVETSASDAELLIKVTPIDYKDDDYIALEVGEIATHHFNYKYEEDKVIAYSNDLSFTAQSLTPIASPNFHPVTSPNLIVKGDSCVYFAINSTKDRKEIDTTLNTAYKNWIASTIHSTGDLEQGLEALRRSLLWNTVYDFKNHRVITPVSRNWCKRLSSSTECKWAFFGDYVLFEWDTFFAGLQFGLISKELAYLTIFSILQEQLKNGMIPNFGSGIGSSYDRSEPPIGSLCVWKLYIQFKDEWFIKECFDSLLKWNRWRFKNRDKNCDGLLELGSDPYIYNDIWNKHVANTKAGAMFESGLDNSPMWDNATYNNELHAMEMSYVGLNALMVLDCEMLEKMARLLGRTDEEKELCKRRTNLTKKINNKLWDEEAGIYKNKHWNNTFDNCIGLSNFFPLIAGIVSKERTNRILNQYLLNEIAFWGEYIFPNVSKQEKSYHDQDYWRGRIWAPTNYLIIQSIIRCENHELWDICAKKGLELFINCWKEKGVVGENYNAITGLAAEGDAASDRFYHWGALLIYICVERVVNFNPFNDSIEMSQKPDWIDSISNILVEDYKKSY